MNIQPFLSSQGVISYVIADTDGTAIIIDPSVESVQTIVTFLRSHTLRPVYLLETHTHADFFSAKDICVAVYPDLRVGLSYQSPTTKKHLLLREGDTIPGKSFQITVRETPGHTNESLTYALQSLDTKKMTVLFTGDTLLIGGTGRTDFQAGDSKALYHSLEALLTYPDQTIIHPNHNYQGQTATTLGVEKMNNARLGLVVSGKEADFIELMNSHTPSTPDLFEVAVPYNSI